MEIKKTLLLNYDEYRLLRLALRITTLEIKTKLDISRSTLWRFENGKDVKHSVVIKLNEYYNTLIDKFIYL